VGLLGAIRAGPSTPVFTGDGGALTHSFRLFRRLVLLFLRKRRQAASSLSAIAARRQDRRWASELEGVLERFLGLFRSWSHYGRWRGYISAWIVTSASVEAARPRRHAVPFQR
jgi:hypothetical protein